MDAIKLLNEHEDEIKKKYGVSKIGVFGSFARGDVTNTSDVDVLIEFREGHATFDNYMGLKFMLQDLFARKVDLVTVKALKPQLREDILREVVYA